MGKTLDWIKYCLELVVIIILAFGLFVNYQQLKQDARDSKYRYLAST